MNQSTNRLDITNALSIGISGGRAYAYVCKPEHRLHDATSPQEGAVRATYIDIVERGLCNLGKDSGHFMNARLTQFQYT
jgi:hypothetical protein